MCVLGEVLRKSFDLEAVDRAVISSVLGEGGKRRKALVDKILEDFSRMSSFNEVNREVQKDEFKNERTFENQNIYEYKEYLVKGIDYDTSDKELRLHVAGIFPKFIAWTKKYSKDFELIPEDSFKKQLRDMSYFIEKKPAKIGVKTKNCYKLNLKKMEEAGLTLSDAWAPDKY